MIHFTLTLKFFGIIGLIYTIKIASSTDENLSNILQCTTPIKYYFLLEIQNTHLIVVSNVDIDFTCTQQCIRLYISRNCDIQTIHVKPNDTTDPFSSRKIEIILQNSTMTHRFKSVDIGFVKHNRKGLDKRKITPGRYTIYSTYNCQLEKIATISTYITKPKNQIETKAFLILPHIPAEWIFPYWEHPAIKANFTIDIIHNDTETAVSNMFEFATVFENTSVFTLFKTTPSISTHLIAAGVLSLSYNSSFTDISKEKTRFISRELARTSIRYAQSLMQIINECIRILWTNTTALSRYTTYVAFPVNFTNYETLVTKGLVIFSETDIMYDEKVDSIVKNKEVTCLVARSVIQEMFSDWFTTCRQSDLWFIEGFSTSYGVYIYDEYYNKYITSLMDSFVVQTRRQFFDYTEAFSKYDLQDTLFISRNSILSKLWRDKGLSTFYMLNKVFSKNESTYDFLYTSMVDEAIHSYYYKTSSNDTCNEQSILDKLWDSKCETSWFNSSYQKMMAKNIITSWTAHVGYPVIQVKRCTDTQNLEIMVIDCFDVDQKKLCDRKWWIPVVLHKITTGAIFTDLTYVLKPRQYYSIDIQFSDENTSVILVNTPGYRVNYDRKSWKNIAFFLKNADSKILKLSDVTLAQILDDAFYFLVQNTQYNGNPDFDNSDVDIYFDLASSLFCVNKTYIAWYPFLTALENISKSFLFPQSVVFKHIKDRLLELLNKFLDDIDDIYSSKNIVNNQLYHEVLKWTCILGGLKCNEHVNKKLQWHFNDTSKHKLLPSWRKWIYCQGLMLEKVTYDKSAIWQALRNMYTTQSEETKRELLELFTCTGVPNNVSKLMSYLFPYFLSPYEVIRNATVTVTFLFNIFAKHSKNIEFLSSILQAIKLINRNFNIVATVSCIINNIYSNKSLSMITNENFLQQLTNIHNTPLFVLDAIKDKVESRRRFLAKMQNT